MLSLKPFRAAVITEEVYPKAQEEKSSNWSKLHGGRFKFNDWGVKCLPGHSTCPSLNRTTMNGSCNKAEALDSRGRIPFT